MRQVKNLILHAYTYKYIKKFYIRHERKVGDLRFRMMENMCALTLQYNYKLRMQRYGINTRTRLLLMGKQYINFYAQMTNDTYMKRARVKILKFFRAFGARTALQAHMRALP